MLNKGPNNTIKYLPVNEINKVCDIPLDVKVYLTKCGLDSTFRELENVNNHLEMEKELLRNSGLTFDGTEFKKHAVQVRAEVREKYYETVLNPFTNFVVNSPKI